MEYRIPFNKPFVVGKELYYISQAVAFGNLSGDGHYTRCCSELLEERFGVGRVLMTPSCTSALELAASLLGLAPGDEVILPSFSYVSAANAVVRLGARPVFVDVRRDTLNLDEERVAAALTPRTRALLPVHYAGIGAEMDALMAIAEANQLRVIEDAAQGVNASYRGRALGSIGQLAAYSFHETKNYIAGQGGALCINDSSLVERAEILRDKGTNRASFLRGEADRYTWVDVGSAHIPNELTCAFLYAQLEMLDEISARRREIHERYRRLLTPLREDGLLRLPAAPEDCRSNCHMFYVLLPSGEARDALLGHLGSRGIQAVFHFVPLHDSPMGRRFGYAPGDFPHSEDLSRRLLRLPFFHEISEAEQVEVAREVERCLRGSGRARSAAGADVRRIRAS